MNKFGDERKQTLDDVLDSESAATLSLIARDVEPIVLGITFWKCYRPWSVPERRICDNFFFMTVSGEEVVAVGKETRLFRRGDAMIVPEFMPHSFRLADGCAETSHFIAHALAENVTSPNPFAGFASPFLHPEHPEAVLDALETIVALRCTDPDAAASLMKQLFKALMAGEARAGRFRLAEKRSIDERVHRSLAFIRANFSGSIAVADIASFVHLGEVQFRKLFRRGIGMAPAAYLRRARLIHAARLIARYDLPLSEVAERSGFANECYFSTAFRNCFARTPGDYRRSLRRG